MTGYAGGISSSCGWGSKGSIINCINLGNVEAYTSVENSRIGGIAGLGSRSGSTCIIENSYSIGNLTGTTTGGILAIILLYDQGTNTLNNNYWLEGCGATNGIGGENSSNTGAEKKTAEELKSLATTLGTEYSDPSSGLNKDYPILTWQIRKEQSI